jgi:uncharacterized protein YaiI (UPF0178 family)
MKILVDADGCPKSVLRICMKTGHRQGVPVWSVASFNHNIESDHHVAVGDDPQEADIKIVNLTEAGDLVVTQDWGLAAMALGKGARCLNPAGWEYRPEKIEFLLEAREVKSRFRRGGGRTKGPRRRTIKDDQRFESSITSLLGHFSDR